MEKVEAGETIFLENGKSYVCFSKIEAEEERYLYLVSTEKPIEIKFAKQLKKGDSSFLTIIGEKEEKQRVFELFKQNININN